MYNVKLFCTLAKSSLAKPEIWNQNQNLVNIWGYGFSTCLKNVGPRPDVESCDLNDSYLSQNRYIAKFVQ